MAAIKEVSNGEFTAEVLEADVPVVVDFWAPWCGPCKMVAPELERLSADLGDRAKIVKVNVDDNQELAIQYGVMSIPTIVKFEGGAVVSQIVGARGADDIAAAFSLS